MTNEKNYLTGTPEYDRHFWNAVRGEKIDTILEDGRNGVTDAYALPIAANNKLTAALTEHSLFRQIGTTVAAYNSGHRIFAHDCDDVAQWVSEGGKFPILNGANDFTRYSVDRWKLGALVKLDEDFVRDVTFKLAAEVSDLDCYGLLASTSVHTKEHAKEESLPVSATVSSFDDVLNAAGALLGDSDPSIFQIEHVTEQRADARHWPDEIANRKPCKDFYNFEKLFRDMQRDIINRKAQTACFKSSSQIVPGDFFILSGLLCFVDSVLKEGQDRAGQDNPRYRVIFENGVETNILKLSLARALYQDSNGRRIIPDPSTVENNFLGLSRKDRATGCIYILASETKAPALADLKNQGRLVKIGYSTQSVNERIKNAENDPTYLEAPVRVLASLDCYNPNPQKVEYLIHAFLAKQRVNITIISSKGVPYKPVEWFAVDRDTAVAVAEHIVKGDILNYRMDNTTGRIKRVA